MQTQDIRAIDQLRLSGRFDSAQEGFPMMWTGASAEMLVKGGALDVQIACDYTLYNPYLSFEVDGLKAQTFSPLKGEHWYSVMLGMDANTTHSIRITLETQAYAADPASYAALLRLRTDGVYLPLPARSRRIEIVGDSITSGEGMRGPKPFMAWVPMCFSATDNYTRMLSDLTDAQIQVVSQSGWGVVCSWDGNPQYNLPAVYDHVCRPAAMHSESGTGHGGEKPYDFSFDPDAVIINLGTNDNGAMTNPPFTDPATGAVHAFTKADLPRFENACTDFIAHIHRQNPRARILWLYGICKGDMAPSIQSAVARSQAEGIDVAFLPLPDAATLPDGVGSRDHPGLGAHRYMAEAIAKALADTSATR